MIYLNHVLSEISPLYGDNGKIDLKRVRKITQGNSSNNTELSFAAHSGTHIDAPRHFDAEGRCLGDYSAEFWHCKIPFLIKKTIKKDEIICLEQWRSELDKIPSETDLLLIKTGFERFRESDILKRDKTYIFHGPGIAPEVGTWLRKNRKLKMIGFDFISLTSYQNKELGRLAHRAFLFTDKEPLVHAEPILIIEDMKLQDLQKSPHNVIVVPLLYEKADGSPVTVLAETTC
jgi:arylformamidase